MGSEKKIKRLFEDLEETKSQLKVQIILSKALYKDNSKKEKHIKRLEFTIQELTKELSLKYDRICKDKS